MWRLRACMRTNAWSGAIEDDLEKFFGRRGSEVGDGEIWRWRAAVEALREIEAEVRGG